MVITITHNYMLDFFGKQLIDGCRVKMEGVTPLLNCRLVNNELYLFSTDSNIKITEELVQKTKIQVTESFRIKADETLFFEMSNILNGFKSLSNIVQNDMTVDPDVIDNWKKVFDLNVQDLMEWKSKMEKHMGV